MKVSTQGISGLLLHLCAAFALLGCGSKEASHHHGGTEEHGHGHGDDAKSFSGATHKEGTGIYLAESTRRVLNIQTSEVEERSLDSEIRFGVRVFGPAKGSAAQGASGSAWLASGIVRGEKATCLKVGCGVTVKNNQGMGLEGVVKEINPGVARPEAEVILLVYSAAGQLQTGSFLTAVARIPGKDKTTVIPEAGLIRSTETNYVYVVNGAAYLKTPVETGIESNNLVEIKDGLAAGDEVVIQGAMDLWLVELRAVKGGQGCCPAPSANGKK